MDTKSPFTNPKRERASNHISPENVNQNNLLHFCEQNFSKEGFGFISRAWDIAHEAHMGVIRKTGGEYVWHPINVAVILVREFGLIKDWKMIVAALLHDVVEDTEFFHNNQDPDNKKL